MKILFCTDGSALSYNALKNLSFWVKDCTIDIVFAVDWSFLPPDISIEDCDFTKKCDNSAKEILENAKNHFLSLGLNIDKTISICGSIVDSILELCDKNSYDLVVLGSNGKKGLQKFLGSVSGEVSNYSKIPTFISKGDSVPDKILLALDDSSESSDMVKWIIENINCEDKEIHLVTVFENPDYVFLDGTLDRAWYIELEEKQKIYYSKLLSQYEQIFLYNKLQPENKVVLNGNISSEIIQYANSNNIGLVICSQKKRTKLARFLLGSTSKRILEGVHSDVLIVK